MSPALGLLCTGTIYIPCQGWLNSVGFLSVSYFFLLSFLFLLLCSYVLVLLLLQVLIIVLVFVLVLVLVVIRVLALGLGLELVVVCCSGVMVPRADVLRSPLSARRPLCLTRSRR